LIFTQLTFLVFFAVTAAVYWALRSNRARKHWLLACSYFFYGYWDYRFLALILASTVFDYGIGLWLARTEGATARRALITASVCVNLGFLGFFKYFNFFVEAGCQLLATLGAQVAQPTLEIVLPVGISFFTFQTMSYTIDVYRRQLPPSRDFFDFALFVGFFPQLVAGPIVRASSFLPQLDRARTRDDVDARKALVLFLVGYFKKACIADNLAAAIDPLFADPAAYAVGDRVLGATLYSVQIYCDFSGYTDMAIATAGLLGYELARNFDAPYLSRNVREFWQRWHISLSTWLRDYLYIPLGGNRGGPLRAARNLMLTMLLGGLWHGANWTFVLWGFLHGLALVVHRALRALRSRAAPGAGLLPAARPAVAVLSWFATLSWVVLCFAIFRCPDVTTAFDFLATPPAAAAPQLSPDLWLLLAGLGAVHWAIAARTQQLATGMRRTHDLVFYPAFGAVCAALPYLTPLSAEPFIYFQF
jgi:alginate O-acetyltransferase complex protein AlgI